MFKKKQKTVAAPADVPVLPDLIIHNMPSATQLGGAPSSELQSAGFSTAASSGHNFKAVGLLIMGGGLVVIGLLAYFSYRFIIQPPAAPADSPAAAVTGNQDDRIVDTETAESPSTAISPEMATSTDLSAPEPLAVETATTSPVATSSPETPEPEPTSIPDSDSDALNDEEEKVFGTDPLRSDSDSDGYSDALELRGGYNPLGAGQLEDTILARQENTVFGYELRYPTAWPSQSLNEGGTLIYTAPDGSLIQIIAQENPDQLPILSWYEESFPGEEVSYGRLKNGPGWEGVMHEDGLNFYLTDERHERIFVISYISAAAGPPSYPFIFQLMIDSLELR